MALYSGDTFEIKGLTFKFESEADRGAPRPWENSEGHGEVREGPKDYHTGYIKKAPGERVLYTGGRNEYTWVYDWAGAMVKAKDEGWGLAEDKRPAGWESMTRGQQAALAVQADFDYLAGWCNDRWQYVIATVTQLITAADGATVEGASDSLGGVENSSDKYLEATAREMAEGLADTYLAELAEVTFWAERDVVTH